MTDRTLTHEDWRAEATAKFGPSPLDWQFVCPVCKHVASVREYHEAGAPKEAGVSCIGRHKGDMAKVQAAFVKTKVGPCDYAGYGFFRLNPVEVTNPEWDKPMEAFEFAEVVS